MISEGIRKKQERDYIRGKKKEYSFKDSAGKINISCEVIKKGDIRDRTEHLDVIMNRDPDIKDWRIDVKTEKEDVAVIGGTWVEIQNVEGKHGWLYDPDLKAIAFEIGDEFWLVDIMKLRKLVHDNPKKRIGFYDKEYMIKNEMYYYPFPRRGGLDEDIIIIVPLKHIEPLIIMRIPICVE